MKKLSLFLISLAILTGCGRLSKKQKVETDGKFSIEMPSFLKKASGLNDDASLQYENQLKEFYVIVIDENIEEFNTAAEESDFKDYYSNDFDGYSDFVLDLFLESLTSYEETDWKDLTINNLKAKQKGIDGLISGINVYYDYTLIKGKNYYYQVLIWTLQEKKVEFKPYIDEIVNSFKEI